MSRLPDVFRTLALYLRTAVGVHLAGAMRTALHALRLGAAYGVRIRLPHALVMTAVFKSMKGSDRSAAAVLAHARSVLDRAVTVTFEHARNLAYFAFLYKLCTSLLQLTSRSGENRGWHVVLAAAVGANAVWARYSHVNYQIMLYVLARVLVALVRLGARNLEPSTSAAAMPAPGQQTYTHTFTHMYTHMLTHAYTYTCIAAWAAVMYLYEFHPDLLQPSLVASMDDIYGAADAASADTHTHTLTHTQTLLRASPTLLVLAHTLTRVLAAGGSITSILSVPRAASE